MRKIFIKHICNILLLSHIPTYKYELTLIVGGLTLKGQVGVLLGEHRGWMLHMAFSYKAKAFRTTAFFPLFQHTAFYFPPSGEPDYQTIRHQTGSLCGFLSNKKNSEHLHAFLFSNICCADGPPFSPERETFCMLSVNQL